MNARIEMLDEPSSAIVEQPRAGAVAVAPTASDSRALMQMIGTAMSTPGFDMDKLERLLAVKKEWEADEARKAYNVAFAAFKAEAVRIIKNRDVTAGPLAGKKYAELFAVVNAVTPALSKHGLSASWKITKDERDWLEVTCTLKHDAGFSESVSMGGPPDAGGAKNAIQARASTVSYLERYTLKAITGLSEQEDDDDGAGAAKSAENIAVTILEGLLEQLKATITDAQAAALWVTGSNALAATKDTASYAEFRDCVVAHRKRLAAAKGGAQ